MPNYRRHYLPGPVFVTLVAYKRRPWMTDAANVISHCMHRCQTKYPFQHLAHVVLPDHLHWLFQPGSDNFSVIVAALKRDLTWQMKTNGESRPLWQARFYDHLIRNEDDFHRHLDYIHYNPVKHGYCSHPGEWPHSSFASWLSRGAYDNEWGKQAPNYLGDMNPE